MSDLTLTDAAVVVPGSGITLTDAATGGNETQAVVAGATYAFTCGTAANSTFHFSITGTILTAANVEWVCTPANTILLRIPGTVTTLNYQSLASGGTGWLRRLEMV